MTVAVRGGHRKCLSGGGIHDNLTETELKMQNLNTPRYSTYFSCLYDEAEPIGNLGRGTHYSIFRCVEWHDVCRFPIPRPQVHDFSVIWDEDHDTRIINAVEQIYMAELLSPVQFIGERKGTLTVIVAAKFYFNVGITEYEKKLNEISQHLGFDAWYVEVGSFDKQIDSPHQTFSKGIIAAPEDRVTTYLRNIDSLWDLGTKKYVPTRVGTPIASPPIGHPPV